MTPLLKPAEYKDYDKQAAELTRSLIKNLKQKAGNRDNQKNTC